MSAMAMRKCLILLISFLFLLSIHHPCPADDRVRPLLQKAVTAFEHSDYSASLKGLNECLAVAEKSGDRLFAAEARLARARLFAEQRYFGKARDDAWQARKEFESLKNTDGAFSCETIILEYMVKRNRDVEAWRNLRRLEKELPGITSQRALADFFMLRGSMLMDQDKDDLAGKNFEEAQRLARSLNDSRRSAAALYYEVLLLASRKDYSKAAECCARAMEEAEKSDSPFMMALVLQASGILSVRQGRLDEALVTFSSAVELFHLCGNTGTQGRALTQKARIYANKGQWELFNASLRKAAAISQAHDNHEVTMDVCQYALSYSIAPLKKDERAEYLALMHGAMEKSGDSYEKAWAEEKEGDSLQPLDQEKALQAYANASKLYREIHDKPGEDRALVMKGTCLIQQGKFDEALRCLNEALPLSEEIDRQGGSEDMRFVRQYSPGAICRLAGTTCLAGERYHDALEYFEKALPYDSGEDRAMLRITDRQGIFTVSISAYDVERARNEMAKALEEAAAMKEPGERACGYNIVINGLLNSSMSMGSTKGYDRLYSTKDTLTADIVKKIYDDPRLYRQILEGYKEWIAMGKERKSPVEEGISQMLLGFFYLAGGKSTEARDAMMSSIEIFNRGKLSQFTGITYFMLGLNYIHEGRKEEAKKSAEESLKYFAMQGDRKNTASISGYIGLICRDMGNLEESLSWYERALRSARETGNKRSVSSILVGMGYTYFAMKRFDEAGKCYNEALAIEEESGNRKEQALVYLFLGRMEKSRSDEKSALDYYSRALNGFKKLGKVFDVRDVALEMGSIYEKSGKEQEALQIYIDALNVLIEVRSRLGEKYLAGSQNDSTKKLFERTVSLLIKAGRYEEAQKYFGLSGSYDLVCGVDISSIGIKDEKMKKLVDEMKVLSRKMKLLQNELEGSQKPDREHYLAGELASTKQQFLAVTNEIKGENPDYGQMIAIQSPELAQLQPVIPSDTLLLQYYPSEETLYIFIVSRESFSIKHLDISRTRLYELIRELREPLEKAGGESDSYRKARLLLYDFLIKPVLSEIEGKAEIEIIPSGLLWYVPFEILGDQEHVSLLDRKAVGYLYSSNIVNMLAAVKKNSREGRLVAFGNPEGADLPASSLEVAKIGSLFPSSLVFTGREATKEAFMGKAPLGTFLHIATHSTLNRDDINSSYIQFAGEKGHLSLGEIYGLSLPEAQLVVLSSCQSALGSDNPGREFASLASAFTVAGAPSVIASLWRTDDASTALLFEEFYGNLKKGMGKGEALRQAKLTLRKKAATASPYYWSSFILLGDWR